MKDLSLKKISYRKANFENTIDTNFSQLANTVPAPFTQSQPTPDITQFFQEYQTLFFQIPKFGSTNSHEYLVKTSGEYIGGLPVDNSSIQALIDEVNILRQQNLELQRIQSTQTLQQAQNAISTVLNG